MTWEKFVIEGGKRLEGRVRPSGSKNEALPCLAATLLAEEEVTLHNMPRIADVLVMCEVIEDLGGTTEWVSDNSLRVDPSNLSKTELDRELCRKIRASILFAGSLVARMGSCTLPPPGGDVIGRRRLDTHFLALEALGAQVETTSAGFQFRAERLEGTEVFMDEASVTATEKCADGRGQRQGYDHHPQRRL